MKEEEDEDDEDEEDDDQEVKTFLHDEGFVKKVIDHFTPNQVDGEKPQLSDHACVFLGSFFSILIDIDGKYIREISRLFDIYGEALYKYTSLIFQRLMRECGFIEMMINFEDQVQTAEVPD